MGSVLATISVPVRTSDALIFVLTAESDSSHCDGAS
jgi:hypothetical protein